MKYKILREKERNKQANIAKVYRPLFVAVDNNVLEPIEIIKPKQPALKLVHSRKEEFAPVTDAVSTSPAPQI